MYIFLFSPRYKGYLVDLSFSGTAQFPILEVSCKSFDSRVTLGFSCTHSWVTHPLHTWRFLMTSYHTQPERLTEFLHWLFILWPTHEILLLLLLWLEHRPAELCDFKARLVYKLGFKTARSVTERIPVLEGGEEDLFSSKRLLHWSHGPWVVVILRGSWPMRASV